MKRFKIKIHYALHILSKSYLSVIFFKTRLRKHLDSPSTNVLNDFQFQLLNFV